MLFFCLIALDIIIQVKKSQVQGGAWFAKRTIQFPLETVQFPVGTVVASSQRAKSPIPKISTGQGGAIHRSVWPRGKTIARGLPMGKDRSMRAFPIIARAALPVYAVRWDYVGRHGADGLHSLSLFDCPVDSQRHQKPTATQCSNLRIICFQFAISNRTNPEENTIIHKDRRPIDTGRPGLHSYKDTNYALRQQSKNFQPRPLS